MNGDLMLAPPSQLPTTSTPFEGDGRGVGTTSVKQSQSMAEQGKLAAIERGGDDSIEHSVGPNVRAFSFDLRGNSLNPILDASAALIALSMRFNNMREPMDLNTLHTRLLHEIESIELELHRLGYDRVTILAHRYCLCSFVDEAIMNSPLGMDTNWGQRSLLALFHNETWGGEKFFTILERMMMEPNRYLHLLEFLYVCLCLGYSGRNQTTHTGRQDLENMIREAHDVIRKTKGAPDTLTLLHGENIFEKAHHVVWRTPVTMVLGIAAVAAVFIYAGFFFFLDHHIDQTLVELSKILGK